MKPQSSYVANTNPYLLQTGLEIPPLKGLSDIGSLEIVLPQINIAKEEVDILTKEAKAEMNQRSIPNLSYVCRALYATFFQINNPNSALQFIPVLKKLTSLNPVEVDIFMKNPKTNHTLVDNALLKVVLVHWKTGQMSSIHGHAKGGCVFKVLKGKIEEIRYSPDASQHFLASTTLHNGGMAYIDDEMAHHAVGNPFDESAISLHVYAKGNESRVGGG